MSLDKKIFTAFFCVALLPFFALLYMSYEGNVKQAQEKIVSLHEANLNQTVLLMREDIKALQRETEFLASLRLMNDTISGDVDKRILDLLLLKKNILKLSTQLSVYDLNGGCVASTFACAKEEGFVFTKRLYLSFRQNKDIGELHLVLPYDSLSYYFQEYTQAWALYQSGKRLSGAKKEEGYMLSRDILDDVVVKVYISTQEYDAPLNRLRQQLISVYFFSFISFVTLFIGVSRALAKPVALNEKLTRQKLALQENELILLEKAKHLAQTKARFLSQISHDFRTPLNSIIGFSQFLDQEKLVAQGYEKLPRNIEKSGKHLLNMVNKLLDFSRSESEHLPVEMKTIDLCALLHELMELTRPMLADKSVDYSIVCEDIRLVSDEESIKNIMLNLLSNAIKFTQKGYVQIKVSLQEHHVLICVKDSGVGISKEEQALLFKPFSRLSNAKNAEGTGLGLALCVAYASRIGAELSYRAHDEGSEFCLTLPKESGCGF